MAKGRQANTPETPFGHGSLENAASENDGAATPTKTSSSAMASTVTTSSNTAAWRTPQALSAVKTRYAATATTRGSTGTRCVTYAAIAIAMAGGAKTNSMSWTTPPMSPAKGPKARAA